MLERAWQMAVAASALLFVMLALALAILWWSGTINRERLGLMLGVLKGQVHAPVPPTDADLRARYEELLRRERQAEAIERVRVEEANRMAAILTRDRQTLDADRATHGVVEASFKKEVEKFNTEKVRRDSKKEKEGLKTLQASLEPMDAEAMVPLLADLDEATLLALMKEFRPDLRADLMTIMQTNPKMSAKDPAINSKSKLDRLIEGLRK